MIATFGCDDENMMIMEYSVDNNDTTVISSEVKSSNNNFPTVYPGFGLQCALEAADSIQ